MQFWLLNIFESFILHIRVYARITPGIFIWFSQFEIEQQHGVIYDGVSIFLMHSFVHHRFREIGKTKTKKN